MYHVYHKLNMYMYTETKKKLSPSLNVDMLVQFSILLKLGFYVE
jgi:hypothetical protein